MQELNWDNWAWMSEYTYIVAAGWVLVRYGLKFKVLQSTADGVQPSQPQTAHFQARPRFFNFDHIHACEL